MTEQLKPWPRCPTCGDLIIIRMGPSGPIETGQCVMCDLPREPDGRLKWTFGEPCPVPPDAADD